MFVYDLMKTDWESRVPHVEAIELNIDIIMSSSPLYTTSQSLLNLIRVEKARKFWNGWLQTLYLKNPKSQNLESKMNSENICVLFFVSMKF